MVYSMIAEAIEESNEKICFRINSRGKCGNTDSNSYECVNCAKKDPAIMYAATWQ